MKKIILVICLSFMLMFTGNAIATNLQSGYITESGEGHLNTGDANGNGVINQGTYNAGDTKTGINDNYVNISDNNVQLGLQDGKNNTAINGDNSGIVDNSVTKGNANNSGIIINQNGQDGCGYSDQEGGDNIVSASIDNSTTIVEDKREHLSQPMITFAELGNYKEGKDMGANFQTVEMLTMFKKVFSYDAAFKDYGKQYGKGKCKTIGHSYNGRYEEKPSKNIHVFTLSDKIDPLTVSSIGFLTVTSVDKDINSYMVLQKAVLSACLMKADAIVVTRQGAETITKSSGWGIGFNTSGGLINDNDSGRGRSAVGSGGTGYSSGKANLITYPWMTVQVLKFK